MCPESIPALSHPTGSTTKLDTLFGGTLVCAQSLDGYRFSVDAVLLAHFAAPRRQDSVLDLGAGCGVIALILAYRHREISLTCLELQASLVEMIRHNVCANRFDERIRIVPGDLRGMDALAAPGGFDLVVCNPPYYRETAGRRNPNPEQAIARHEMKAGLDDILRAGAFALRTKGRLAMIYPASRLASLLVAMGKHKLEPKRLRPVYSYPGSDAALCLVEAVKCGGEELAVLPPLFIYARPGGDYNQEVAAYYR